VLSIGGTVKVNDQGREIKATADLPTEAFRLTQVLLYQNKQVSDAGLAHFKDCKNLTQFDLGHTKVSDAGLAHFKDCKNLTELNLQKTKVTAAKIEELKKALPGCSIKWDGM
jgi:Leucine-rich repeat (LRR) protein